MRGKGGSISGEALAATRGQLPAKNIPGLSLTEGRGIESLPRRRPRPAASPRATRKGYSNSVPSDTPCNLWSPEIPRPAASATHTHSDERMTPRTCPTCGGPVPPASGGRPPTYCGTPCRRTMYGMAAELRDLEEQAADARNKAESGYAPGAYFHEAMHTFYAAKADELRERVPEHLQ